MPRKARWLLLRAAGVKAHAWNIAPCCDFTGPAIAIGRGTFINRFCVLDASAPIEIGSGCALGLGVMILTGTHAIGPPERRAGELQALPVTIGDGCWIGSRATILPGAVIAPGTVIAAGAIVRGACEPDGLYAGVPARLVRRL